MNYEFNSLSIINFSILCDALVVTLRNNVYITFLPTFQGFAIGMLITAVPIFMESYDLDQSVGFKIVARAANAVLSILVSKSKIPAEELVRMILWTSAITIGVGVLQLLNSLFLLVFSCRQVSTI